MAKIVSTPNILGGKPVIYGTRISVELIMNFLSAGMSIEDIVKEYPELKKTEVSAAIEYAKKLVRKSTSYRNMDSAPAVLHEITS